MAEIVLMADRRVSELPVREVGEELVDLRVVVPQLALDGAKETPDGAFAYLRRGVADRLLRAQEQLPGEYRLLLMEGYRPPALQERYFSGYRRRLETLRPELDPATSFELASRYVAPPAVAPHVSGAAIDLTLVGSSGEHVDMGTAVNATPEESAGACYFGAENISAEARNHRRILAGALEAVGLVNYPTEWWHWSYGDRYWALVNAQPAAIYGPVDELSPAEHGPC